MSHRIERLAFLAAILPLLLAHPARSEENRKHLAGIVAGIESKTEVSNLTPELETRSWKELTSRAGSYQVNTVSRMDALPAPGLELTPGIRTTINGPIFSGHAGVSYVDRSGLELGIGYYLQNANRRRIRLFNRLAAQSEQKAELIRKSILLSELKVVLSTRNFLERMEAEIRQRSAFAGFVDSLLAKLEPYAKDRLISANSLNNVHALRESNATTIEYLRKESRMVVKGVHEQMLIDTSAFLALDIRELVDSIEAVRRGFPVARPNYAGQFDSIRAEIEKEKLLLNRIQDSHLLLGVDISERDPWESDGGVSLGVRLEWRSNFGNPPPAPLARVKSLPSRTVTPLDPNDVSEMDERTDQVSRKLRQSIEGRLTDIRLGQTASVYSISENLGYLLAQPLQAESFRASYLERSLSGINALEDLGL